jgi:hypothetical protein
MLINSAIIIGILLGWIIISLAPAAKLGYEDRKLPEESRRGVSIFPVIPFAPAIVIGIYFSLQAYTLNLIAVILLIAQGVILVYSVIYIAYWMRRLAKAAEQGDSEGTPLRGAPDL